jgi:hypothetical protein
MTEATAPKQPKNCISYRKIATFRTGMKPTESGGRMSSSSFTFFAFEKRDGISFTCRARNISCADGRVFDDYFRYKLQLRTLKSGRQSFVFYKIRCINAAGGKAVSTSTPNDMRSRLASLVLKQESNRKKPRFSILVSDLPALYAAQQERLLSFVRKFLRGKKISFKHLSKDPFSLMFQLCYQGAIGFDDSTIKKVTIGAALLDDPVRLALRTNGKKSRRLVYQAIKAHPEGAQSILRVAKYLRVNRSLDSAQSFLELVKNEPVRIIDWRFMEDAVYRLKASELKFLSPLSENELVRSLLLHYTLYGDTVRMLRQVNAAEGQGFDLSVMRYKTLRELHDQLIRMLPGQRGGGSRYKFEHYEFDTDCLSMKFCDYIARNFSSDDYSVVYPRSSQELQSLASKMHNCAFAYSSNIKDGSYAIFCLTSRETGRPEYMFGYSLQKFRFKYRDLSGDFSSEAGKCAVTFNQAVGACNRQIEEPFFGEVINKIRGLLEGPEWTTCPF